MDPLTLRFVERVVAVLIGGGAIYLGYRLFLEVPEARTGEGKFTFPWDVSVVLTRVGPGVFFALFGAVVVGTSFFKGIELQYARQVPAPSETRPVTAAAPPAASVESFGFKGAGRAEGDDAREARADARALLRKDIAILNSLPGSLRANLAEQDRSLIEQAIPRIKLALMKPVWGDPSAGWGDVARFEVWQRTESDPPPAELKEAVDYYRAGKAGKR